MKNFTFIFVLILTISSVAQTPNISVTPVSISKDLFTGQSSKETMTISNSGTGNLIFTNSIDFTPSGNKQNHCLQFDGVDDYAEVPNHASLNIEKEITIECWLNFKAGGTIQPRLISKGPDGGGYELLLTNESSVCNFEVRIGPGNLISNSKLYAGNWYHVAATYDGSSIRLYINGTLDTTKESSGNLNLSSLDLHIGQKSTAAYDKYRGLMDEVRLWNIALSYNEIEKNMYTHLTGSEQGLVGYWPFNEGNGSVVNDFSVNKNHGMLYSGVSWIPSTAPILPYWLTFAPDSGLVTTGSSIEVSVQIDALGLEGGNYEVGIIVLSNDPQNTQITVPVNLQVTSAPDIWATESTLIFGGHFVGATVEKKLIISNRGFDPLIVSGVSSNHSDYKIDAGSFILNPYEKHELVILFTPSTVGNLFGNLTILSNDPDVPSLIIDLEGEGLIPPEISVSSNGLNENLLSGRTATHTFTINNSGGSDLSYHIRIGNIENGKFLMKKVLDDDFLPIQTIPALTSDLSLEKNQSYCPSGLQQSIDIIGQDASASTFTPLVTAQILKILLITSQNEQPIEIQKQLLNFNAITTIDIFDARSSTPTLNYLLDYHAVIVMNHLSFMDPEGIGDILADYADAGGGVILTIASFASGFEVKGRFLNDSYNPFNIGSGPAGNSSIGSFNKKHTIMSGITMATGDLLTDVSVATGAETIAEWENGFPFVATKGRNIAAVNVYVISSGSWTGDIPLILYNSICWSFGAGWLSAAPNSGIISAGLSTDIIITFDAAGLNGGEYSADIIISNNDPISPEVSLPAQLKVTDAPAIAVENDTVDFGQIYVGETDTIQLIVTNRGSMDLLILSAACTRPEYSVYPPFAGIDPGENEIFTITFTQQIIGIYPGTLIITSNDPLNGSYIIQLNAQAAKPPIITISPDSLDVVVLPGATKSEQFTINNLGESNLYFDLTGGFASTNYACQFDGVDDYIEIPDNPELSAIGSAFTLEFWIKIDELPNSSQEVMGKWGIGWTEDDEYNVNIYSSGIIEIGISGVSGQTISAGVISKIPLQLKTWTHKAAVFDANNSSLTMYTNGSYDNSVNTNTILLDRDTNQPFRIGTSDFTWFPHFKGYLDEIKIWNIARTQDAIQSQMDCHLYGSEEGLVGYWPFNEGAGRIVNDLSGNENNGLSKNGVFWTNSAAPQKPGWFTSNCESGLCSSHSSIEIEILFDSKELDTGDYYSSIIIKNNDPARPTVILPIHMLVSTTGIDDDINFPLVFNLFQNYPNPFNPSTTIEFQIPNSEFTTLKVYNILGKEVSILVSKHLNQGNHTYTFNGKNMASGVYYYSIVAGEYRDVKKMILLK